MGQRGRPPGSNNKPKLYQYVVVTAISAAAFENQLNAMAAAGWRVIGAGSGGFFSAVMEKERGKETTTGTGTERA